MSTTQSVCGLPSNTSAALDAPNLPQMSKYNATALKLPRCQPVVRLENCRKALLSFLSCQTPEPPLHTVGPVN